MVSAPGVRRIATRRSNISRRGVLGVAATGIAAAGGALFSTRPSLLRLPPNMGSLSGLTEGLSYSTETLLTGHRLVPEYPKSAITYRLVPENLAPGDPEFIQALATGFDNWRLPFVGRVERPTSFSLAELHRLPQKSQNILFSCFANWSQIAPFTGVPLAAILAIVGLRPSVRYIGFESFGGDWESIDLIDAFHPQTLLTLEARPGESMGLGRGHPLRLCAPLHYGYKQIKWIKRITALDNLDDFADGTGTGSFNASFGFSWLAGPL